MLVAAGIVGALAFGGQTAFAEEGTNVSQDAVKTGTPVAKLYAMARDLVDYGRQNNDAGSRIEFHGCISSF